MATVQQRMKALNHLKGAAGQPNRSLVIVFLKQKGWMDSGLLPEENWDLAHVPTTQKAFLALAAEVEQFAIETETKK